MSTVKLYPVTGTFGSLCLAGVEVKQDADGGFPVPVEQAAELCVMFGMTTEKPAQVEPAAAPAEAVAPAVAPEAKPKHSQKKG